MRVLLAALLLGCAPEPDLSEVLRELHGALYAEDAGDDDALWERLSGALAGDALTQAYVEARVARERMARQGQRVRVLGVEYGDIVAEPPDDQRRPRLDATWWVRGIVWHGDHSHARINAYRAVYTLDLLPQGWRVVEVGLRDLSRVRSTADVLQDGGLTPAAGGYMDPLELIEGLQ